MLDKKYNAHRKWVLENKEDDIKYNIKELLHPDKISDEFIDAICEDKNENTLAYLAREIKSAAINDIISEYTDMCEECEEIFLWDELDEDTRSYCKECEAKVREEEKKEPPKFIIEIMRRLTNVEDKLDDLAKKLNGDKL